ncbi:MAG: pyruvate dehydrogenase (acetyl-transferring) E1 component subunit alpha [Myxococcales bacterium]|nr:pyruvate dehydrogenase (acetyl-transferring) E1 component subunit alpha [Myxococcales bacterium]
MYRKMVLVRRFEERAGQQYGLGKIAGFCHLYIGQEAVAAGATVASHPDDYMIAAYREHGHALARGADPRMVMAELFGRHTGYSKGKGGSMHLFDVEHYFFGGYGIVGGQIPLATGIGFASRYRDEGRVVLCFFGEAAANQGSFHESLNMASKWKLPVLYLCENNRYGMGTLITRVAAVAEIYKRAAGYAMRGEQVDGMDAVEVFEAVAECAGHCRAGKGPVLLEANTYRFRGHSMADPATYRDRQEVEEERKRDPVPKLRQHILESGTGSPEQLDAIDREERARVDAAVKFADQSPEPPLEELRADTFVAEGEEDVRPRARVLGAHVAWPEYPASFEVTWELEPRATTTAEQKATDESRVEERRTETAQSVLAQPDGEAR